MVLVVKKITILLVCVSWIQVMYGVALAEINLTNSKGRRAAILQLKELEGDIQRNQVRLKDESSSFRKQMLWRQVLGIERTARLSEELLKISTDSLVRKYEKIRRMRDADSAIITIAEHLLEIIQHSSGSLCGLLYSPPSWTKISLVSIFKKKEKVVVFERVITELEDFVRREEQKRTRRYLPVTGGCSRVLPGEMVDVSDSSDSDTTIDSDTDSDSDLDSVCSFTPPVKPSAFHHSSEAKKRGEGDIVLSKLHEVRTQASRPFSDLSKVRPVGGDDSPCAGAGRAASDPKEPSSGKKVSFARKEHREDLERQKRLLDCKIRRLESELARRRDNSSTPQVPKRADVVSLSKHRPNDWFSRSSDRSVDIVIDGYHFKIVEYDIRSGKYVLFYPALQHLDTGRKIPITVDRPDSVCREDNIKFLPLSMPALARVYLGMKTTDLLNVSKFLAKQHLLAQNPRRKPTNDEIEDRAEEIRNAAERLKAGTLPCGLS